MRWDGRLVRIFNERMQPIAVHIRQEPGRFSTPTQYIASEKISAVERGAAWLLERVTTRLGPHSATWAEAIALVGGELDAPLVDATLGLLLKYRDDVERVRGPLAAQLLAEPG